MGTEKRARQKENRQRKLEELEKSEQKDKIRQYGILAAIVAVALVGGLALLSWATGDDDPETATTEAGSDESAQDSADPDSADAGDDTGDDAAEAASEPIECPADDGSSEQLLEFPAPPPSCIDPAATYTATFDTNMGTIVAELDAAKAPNTVNNFVYLARYHYYDGTTFHRVIEDFMIQGGDPNGDPPGSGGPGYTIDEETPAAGEYQIGSLAMAKRTPPSTTGAQFFIVTGPNGEGLPPEYSLFGQVTEGLDVVEAIEVTPTGERDVPNEDVIINSISITQS